MLVLRVHRSAFEVFGTPQSKGTHEVMQEIDLVITLGLPQGIWITLNPTRGLGVRIILELVLLLGHDCAALCIFTRAGERNYSLGPVIY